MIVTKQNENNISKNYMQNNFTKEKQRKTKKGEENGICIFQHSV